MNVQYMIEKIWITKAGLIAMVLKTSVGHRCGYVAVKKEHDFFALPYQMMNARLDCLTDIDCHMGITFADKFFKDDELWWFGFDCCHGVDLLNPKDLDFCILNCESLSDTLQNRNLGLRNMAEDIFNGIPISGVTENILLSIFRIVYRMEGYNTKTYDPIRGKSELYDKLITHLKDELFLTFKNESEEDFSDYFEWNQEYLLGSYEQDIEKFFELKYGV